MSGKEKMITKKEIDELVYIGLKQVKEGKVYDIEEVLKELKIESNK